MSGSSDRTKFVVWRERLERFPRSGLTVVGFCVGEGVSAASFYQWRKKLGNHDGVDYDPGLLPRRPVRRRKRLGSKDYVDETDGPALDPPSPTGGRGPFRRVAVVPALSGMVGSVPAVCIQLPGGTRIEVGDDDLDAVRTVIAEVARADRGLEAGVARC